MAFVGFSLNPIDWVSSAAGSLLGSVTDGVFDALTAWVEAGLTYLGQQIATLILGFGDGDLSGDAFSSLSSMFRYLAVSVVVGTIMVSVAGSLVSKKVELDDVLRHTPTTLMMLAGWSAVSALWLAGCRALTAWALGDALVEGLLAGVGLNGGIASFFRFLIAIVLLIAMAVFAIEMLFIGFLAPFAVAIGPIALALWPWPAMRDVAKRMVANFVLLTLTPFLTAAAMRFALQSFNGEALGFADAMRAIAGMMVAVLMPASLKKFLPLDGSGGSAGRAMIAAAAGIAAAAAMVASGGTAAVAAAGAGPATGGQLTQLSGGGTGGPPGGGTGGPPGNAAPAGAAGESSPAAAPPAAAPSGDAPSGDASPVAGPSGGSDDPPPATQGRLGLTDEPGGATGGGGGRRRRDPAVAAMAGAQVAGMLGERE